MKKMFILFLIVFAFSWSLPCIAYAQVNPDPVETPSKFSRFCTKIKKKVEKAWNWVQNSKLYKAIEKGVKGAKNFFKFAKGVYDAGQEGIANTLNSDEVKMALLAKDIAMNEKSIASIKSKIKTIESEHQQEIDLKVKLTDGKIRSFEQNTSNLSKSGDKMDEYIMSNEEQVQKLNEEMEQDISNLDTKTNAEIVGLKKELKALEKEREKLLEKAAVLSKDKVGDKINAAEEIAKKKLETFIPKGEIESLSNIYKIKEKRFEDRRDTILETYTKVLQLKEALAKIKEEAEDIGDGGVTMSSKSSMKSVNTEVILYQMKELKKYIEVVVADLKLETTLAKSTSRSFIPLSEDKNSFNLCNYDFKPNEVTREKKKSAFDKIKDAKAKGEKGLGSVKEGVSKAQSQVADKMNEANAIAGQLNSITGQVGGLAGQAGINTPEFNLPNANLPNVGVPNVGGYQIPGIGGGL